ncbi:MAG: hypothetical protein WEA11_07860 [Acidimicrobiales bacterium]
MTIVLFGHQGGWDEALMVLVPIALFVGLLWLATRRAKALQAKRSRPQQSLDPLEDPASKTNT